MSNQMFTQDLSVLLIEPSDVQRKLISRSLSEAGINNIENAENISKAMHSLTSFTPDLVISSMYLSDGTADDLLQLIRNNPDTENQAFMLISSERNKSYLESLRQSGVLAILPKPFNSQDLTRAIKATTSYINSSDIDLEFFDPKDLKVLVVDDSRLSRKHILRTMQSMGIENFNEAENGKEAILLLEDNKFDLVVTDYNMPEMDGRELTELIRMSPELAHIPILMVSSESNESHLSNIAQAGVDAICDKPFDPTTVRELLSSILN
ncbi:response regulator [Marinomonas sp. 15G1-11]|uniref:Response regulator n=1 Tax=Marinomonas phaeophyticola TaxID=3004091 RepID=A0ABT4JY00_9GAMM|nr:response regulator [Marinomonas sp. 15G1-11]MCZ2723106.1 response regulator [Marinomonas sp. 15G1-11]